MDTRTPEFRFSVRPFGSIDDGLHVSIQVRRVDGDPDGGPLGMRSSPAGVDVDAVLAELGKVLSRMRAADDATRPQPSRADPAWPVAGGWLLSEGLQP